MISLLEYAKAHGKSGSAARRMALRGGFKTATKIGRDWLIDPSEPWPDRRVKSGRYVGARPRKAVDASQMQVNGF